MKPFDLEAAKEGKPIITRDGRKAKFIAHIPEAVNSCRVVCMVEGKDSPVLCDETGMFSYHAQSGNDLFMAPEVRWVNFYSGGTAYHFPSEKEANDYVSSSRRIGNKAYPVETN